MGSGRVRGAGDQDLSHHPNVSAVHPHHAVFDPGDHGRRELRQVSTLEAIQDWMKGVECSISRAALALADDLETAAMLLSAEPEASGLGPKERAQDLLTYAVSEPYFKLREHLGLSIR